MIINLEQHDAPMKKFKVCVSCEMAMHDSEDVINAASEEEAIRSVEMFIRNIWWSNRDKQNKICWVNVRQINYISLQEYKEEVSGEKV